MKQPRAVRHAIAQEVLEARRQYRQRTAELLSELRAMSVAIAELDAVLAAVGIRDSDGEAGDPRPIAFDALDLPEFVRGEG